MSASVFVGNLNYQTTEAQLSEFFGTVGRVVSVRIPLDRDSGRSRGFGFVEFESDEIAEQAIADRHDAELDGRRLRVNKADSKPARTRGPRPGGARPGSGYTRQPPAYTEAPEMEISHETSSGHGRRDDWRSLRGKKRTL
ncbi:MAG: RNA recognition motif domain-containing protein [Thermoanaerobaculia bacterium]